jgi:hypothetical protein
MQKVMPHKPSHSSLEVGQRSTEGYATQTEAQFAIDAIYSENSGVQLH